MSCCTPTRCPALVPKEAYTAQGTFEEIESPLPHFDKLRYYIISKGNSERAVVVYHDIYGVDSGRHMAMCDDIAERLKCTVVCPDLYHGVAKNPGDDMSKVKEVAFAHPIEDVQKDLDVIYNTVLSDSKRIATVGFCWGSWVAFHEGARQPEKLKCGVNYHPSLRLEGFFGRKVVDLATSNKLPQLVCPCKDDPAEEQPGGAIPSSTTTFHVFGEQNHGFCSQGDVSQEAVKRDVAKAMELLVDFINEKC
mmetsp:Transcript_32268/g.51465  ORF Transcript_32268/g.51465 Transcript_32268/m.51465 type:complete len:250 (-) Transcript_32268:4930-5679(-)